MNCFNLEMFFTLVNHARGKDKLATTLNDLFVNGFIVMEDCLVLEKLGRRQPHIKLTDFVDKTGYECFVNSIHVDDYVTDNLFTQALLFIDKLISELRILKYSQNIAIIMSDTGFGFNIKFHVLRENASWVDINELHKFKEAILVLEIPALMQAQLLNV